MARQLSLSKFGFCENKTDQVLLKRKHDKESYEHDKRTRGWVDSWSEKFPGIRDTPDGMVCDFCKTVAGNRSSTAGEGSSSFFTGCKSYRIDTLRAHVATSKHKLAAEGAAREARGGEGPLDLLIEKIGRRNMAIMTQAFNTSYCVMKHEMPFTNYPVLLGLQVKNGSELKHLLSYGSNKACTRFAPHIAAAIREPYEQAVRDAPVFSILFDGATDCSINEVEIVYCRYLERGYPKDVLVGLADVRHAHSEGVFDAISQAMERFAGPAWLDRLAGAGCDGAAVNLGVNNSVATRLKAGHPYVLPVHCVAHRLEIGALRAIKDHRHLDTIHDMFKKLYKHYHYSPKALRELQNIAHLMDEQIIKPTRLQGTRWLPHIRKASEALIRGYPVLLAHFEHVSQAGPGQATAEVKGRATFLVRKLKNLQVLCYLFFMQDVLEIVARLSLAFQKDGATCADFLDALEAAVLELTEIMHAPGEKFRQFIAQIDADGVYRGAKLDNYQQGVLEDYYHYEEECDAIRRHITQRLEHDVNHVHEKIKAARVFDTKQWPHNREDLAHFGNEDVQFLSEHFQTLLETMGCDVPNIQREWTLVKAHLGHRVQNVRPQALPVINQLFTYGGDRFQNILKLVEIVLVLPMSSAICERGFSCVKRIKSDWRSRLATDVLNHLLFISVEGPTLEEYVAERAVHLWWNAGQRRRRPQFELPQAPEDDDDDGENDLLNFLLDQNNQ